MNTTMQSICTYVKKKKKSIEERMLTPRNPHCNVYYINEYRGTSELTDRILHCQIGLTIEFDIGAD